MRLMDRFKKKSIFYSGIVGAIFLIIILIVLIYKKDQRFQYDITKQLGNLPDNFWVEKGKDEPYVPKAVPNGLMVWNQDQKLLPVLRNPKEQLKKAIENDDFSACVVIIDPGHGGDDPGAVVGAVQEKDITLPLSLKIKAELDQAKINAILLRTEDKTLSLYARNAIVAKYCIMDYLKLYKEYQSNIISLDPNIAKELGGIILGLDQIIEVNRDDFGGIMAGIGASHQMMLIHEIEKQYSDYIYLSIHANSSPHTTQQGSQIFLSRNYNNYIAQQEILSEKLHLGIKPIEATRASSYAFHQVRDKKEVAVYPVYMDFNDDLRVKLATNLYAKIEENLPEMMPRNVAKMQDHNFVVLRTNALSNVLIETGFMTNPEDLNRLLNSEYQTKFAQTIREGVLAYFKDVVSAK